MQDILALAKNIRLVIFDVDGVLTDGSLFMGDNGQEYKAFYSRDGHGMKMLQSTGVHIGVITGRTSKVVKLRMKHLGIEHVFQGQDDKLKAYEKLKATLELDDNEISFVGDDIVDLPVMKRVGLAIAVNDADPLVSKHAHWRTPNRGGRGAARDVCEMIMESQNTLAEQLNKHL